MKHSRIVLGWLVVNLALSLFALHIKTASAADNRIAIPEMESFVVDTTGTLSAEQLVVLNTIAAEIDRTTQVILPVIVVPSLNGAESIEEFGLRVMETWHPGHTAEAQAAILVLDLGGRKVRIETSRYVSGVITDARSSRVIHELKTHLRKTDIYSAVFGYYTLMAPYAGEIYQESLDAKAPMTPAREAWGGLMFILAVLGACTGIGLLVIWYRKRLDHQRKLAASAAKRDADAFDLRTRRAGMSVIQAEANARAESIRDRYETGNTHPSGPHMTPKPSHPNKPTNNQRPPSSRGESSSNRRSSRRDDDDGSTMFAAANLAASASQTSRTEPPSYSPPSYSPPDTGGAGYSGDGGGSTSSFD